MSQLERKDTRLSFPKILKREQLWEVVNMKKCSTCGEVKSLKENFNVKKASKDGYTSQCKACIKISKQRYYQNNKEKLLKDNAEYKSKNEDKIRSYKKDWYENNKESITKKRKKYYIENKDKISQYEKDNYETISKRHKRWLKNNKERVIKTSKIYYEINKDKIKEYSNQYKKVNKEKYAIHEQVRRALIMSTEHSYTEEEWNQTKISFDNKCAYCGKLEKLTQDHLIPLSKGGEYTINNIIPACSSCNSSKRNRDFFKWYPLHKHYSKQRENKILNYLNYYNNHKEQQLSIL